MRRFQLALAATLLCAGTAHSLPPIVGSGLDDPAPAAFPRPASLEPAVAFWTRVFAEFSEYHSIVHSMQEPQRIFAVLDFREVAARKGAVAARREQRRGEARAKRELDQLLRRVHDQRHRPDSLTDDERQVYDLFTDSGDDTRFRDAVGRFRAQRGLRERTANALRIAGRYLPQMETIFREEGMPLALTRLPLVESSFNIDAYSKAGAAGLWQFIPSTARIYMKLDEVVDQRRDPWIATRAAARHLRDDFDALGSWPLAITAYNHGRLGVARALRKVGGDSLEDLVANHSGRRFGFASRNFYASFLAALDVERNRLAHFGHLQPLPPLEFESVPIDAFASFAALAGAAGLDAEAFHELNPGFRPEVFQEKLFVPPGTEIRVPQGRAGAFRTAYAALGPEAVAAKQKHYYVRYRVRRGDTISQIAERHGVSQRSLRAANGIRNPRYLRIGQVLKVPPRQWGGQVVKVSNRRVRENGSDYLLHRVRRGQSLYSIARRYGTTIAALRRHNGLQAGDVLRTGVTLKVPTG